MSLPCILHHTLEIIGLGCRCKIFSNLFGYLFIFLWLWMWMCGCAWGCFPSNEWTYDDDLILTVSTMKMTEMVRVDLWLSSEEFVMNRKHSQEQFLNGTPLNEYLRASPACSAETTKTWGHLQWCFVGTETRSYIRPQTSNLVRYFC